MKVPVDLFGQVPITRVEVKRKVRQMPSISTEKIVAEIILEKVANECGLMYTKIGYQPFLRQFQIKELSERINEATNFYSQLCTKKSDYQPYIKALKKYAKQNYLSPEALAYNQKKRHLKLEQVSYAHQLIHLATKTCSLNLTQLKQIANAKVDPRFIPWEYANEKAIEFGKMKGIYIKPTLPYQFIQE